MKRILQPEADKPCIVTAAEFNRVLIPLLTRMPSPFLRCMQSSSSTIACVEFFVRTLLDVLVEAKRLASDAHARYPLMKD
jgi:hypothetical protein